MKDGRKSKSCAALGLLLSTLLAPQALVAQTAPAALVFDTGMLPRDHIILPDGEVSTTIFLVSDADDRGGD